jgi:hypothetical protein
VDAKGVHVGECDPGVGSLRFRRTISLGGGFRLNLNKRSVGVSAGTRGARDSVNSDGRSTRSVGVPGSGLYYRDQTGPRRRRRPDGSLSVNPNSKAGTFLAVIGGLSIALVFVALIVASR